jgi:hypothetical protein
MHISNKLSANARDLKYDNYIAVKLYQVIMFVFNLIDKHDIR